VTGELHYIHLTHAKAAEFETYRTLSKSCIYYQSLLYTHWCTI